MSLLPPAHWHELQRPNKSSCPKLFYAFSTEQNGCTLKLTDLVAIWDYSIDRACIVQYAREQHTSIDPSESLAQLRVLLDRLEQSLAAGNNHLFRAKERNTQTVYLETNLDLPKPLKPLSWTFELVPRGAGELAEQLLRPCLHEASLAKQKLESLLRVLREKDHVISRLLEKAESSGTDLSLTFPGITGLKSRKGRVTIQEARKHVPGLADFDRGRWLRGFNNDSPYAGFHEIGMASLVAGCERCPNHTVKQHDDWLTQLPIQGSQSERQKTQAKEPVEQETAHEELTDGSVESEDEFQTQPTPPHLKRPKSLSGKAAREESDVSESGPGSAKARRLGRVGGLAANRQPFRTSRGRTSSSETEKDAITKTAFGSTSQPERQTHESDAASETETASESGTERPVAKFAGPMSPSQDIRKPIPRKLGRLGSSKSDRQLSSQSSSTISTQQPNAQQAAKHHRSVSQSSASESCLQSHSISPLQRKTRLGGARNGKSFESQSTGPRQDIKHDSGSGPKSIGHVDIGTQDQHSGTAPSNSCLVSASTSTSTSKQTTPRKLGRLKRSNTDTDTNNHDDAHQTTPTKIRTKPIQDTNLGSLPAFENDETETESDNDPLLSRKSLPATRKRKKPHSRSGSTSNSDLDSKSVANANPRSPSHHTQLSSSPAPQSTEPVKKETAEEAANRRREELKQRIITAGSGVRKKRKF